MIIKGLFRRYERWNPVHPTAGTFWGMGIGVGCGVGWGPGFGPEVIGYVGAGCGVGFSVGITLAGVGIGLPMNGLLQVPYSAFPMSSVDNDSLEFANFNAFTTMKSIVEDGWNYISPHINFPKIGASERLPSFKIKAPLVENNEFDKAVTMHMKSTSDHVEALKDRYGPPRKGN